MQPIITYNDAWESIPLEYVDDVLEFFDYILQPTHPLRSFKLFPIAKCWRRHKYLVEEEESSDLLWVLDMHRKKRIRGKTCYWGRLFPFSPVGSRGTAVSGFSQGCR